MEKKNVFIIFIIIIILIFSCSGQKNSIKTDQETTSQNFLNSDFKMMHSLVNNDNNKFLIFGNIPVSSPSQDISSKLAAFLGRWEGYDYSPPVKKDYKIVLVIQDIRCHQITIL